jgi:hypothetical protein
MGVRAASPKASNPVLRPSYEQPCRTNAYTSPHIVRISTEFLAHFKSSRGRWPPRHTDSTTTTKTFSLHDEIIHHNISTSLPNIRHPGAQERNFTFLDPNKKRTLMKHATN